MVYALAYWEELRKKAKDIFQKVDKESLDEFNIIVCGCTDKLNKFEKSLKVGYNESKE